VVGVVVLVNRDQLGLLEPLVPKESKETLEQLVLKEKLALKAFRVKVFTLEVLTVVQRLFIISMM
jgi:hypothetical protein